MTFEEWLEEKLDRATKTAEESWMIAPASYGTGWDKGYEAAIQEIFSAIPASIARCDFLSPQDTKND